ncbi:MAG TPA: N-6 DNA methylase [Ktedonobacteraceae bacterium]|nr:N-6 DNA methylase [Ktedonobacteraceae bacterium]
MSTPQFQTHFAAYLSLAQQAREQNQHHDQRRQLFLEFLQKAFDIELADIEVEKFIQIANQQVAIKGIARVRKGWIDAVFKDIIFEFKRDVKREEADGLRELFDYLTTISDGTNCVGLLTDGLTFVAYVLDAQETGGLRRRDSINLETVTPDAAYLWLDAYLLRQRDVPPTSADIVRRFGLMSPTFDAASRSMRMALKKFAESAASALEVKRQQWAFHLARVYGSADANNDEMFIRHTYLCQFAKVLAYTAKFGAGDAARNIEGIIDGKAFEILGIGNIGEQDFFAWVLAPEVRQQTLSLFSHIAASLIVYNLQRIDEDLLKQLYQNLVEPETRHELGEFYTPDWLAELTLREIGFGPGQSLLDPACGSGTFLFTAIRLLVEQGLTGHELAEFALNNIMGMDVHPLAVTIAKINYMLAIQPHLQGGRRRTQQNIPITMANALQVPSKTHHVDVIEIPIDSERAFQIPVEAAQHPQAFAQVLYWMNRHATDMAQVSAEKAKFGDFGEVALEALSKVIQPQDAQAERLMWSTNAKWLTKQITEKRDSIWMYVLQNSTRPLFFWYRKFDVVIGNPPWISYRYLQDPVYQNEIKKLTREYELSAASDMKLNTQMELASLFFEHCSRVYLKPTGTIAFVMPRSVMTGAKQHYAFQQRGFSRILDLKNVAPLFNVETCVMIREHQHVSTTAIPTQLFKGRLPAHECKLSVANALIERSATTTDFNLRAAIGSPYYHPKFKQGATLVPRNLTFVASAQPGLKPGQISHIAIMRTEPDVNDDAKVPWKGLRLQAHIDDDFLYATLLSKNLVPFGMSKLHLVALPMRVGMPKNLTTVPNHVEEERFIPVSTAEMHATFIYGKDFYRSAVEWFEPTERYWGQYKKSTVKETLWQWFNYQNKLLTQSPEPGYLVLYGATGSNLAAAVVDTHNLPVVNGAEPKAFVVDHKTYWYRSPTLEEAHFLCALLNAPCINEAIKEHQTRGLFGERDIHRRPFEVCAIPQFDAQNLDHLQLAELSQMAHSAVFDLHVSSGGVVAIRKQARLAVNSYLKQIDESAKQLLGLNGE